MMPRSAQDDSIGRTPRALATAGGVRIFQTNHLAMGCCPSRTGLLLEGAGALLEGAEVRFGGFGGQADVDASADDRAALGGMQDGLELMRHRAQIAGGALEIGSAPAAGT